MTTDSTGDQALERRELGRTGVEVTALGFGGATIGIDPSVTEARAQDTLHAAWEAGLRYFDTAPWYGRGLSELRVGQLLRGLRRDQFVLSTKVGRVLRAPVNPHAPDASPQSGGLPFEVRFDYSRDGILRAYEDCLQRLGLARIDLAIVHDLDLGYHAPQARWGALMGQLITGGWQALADLRAAGLIRGIGVGINPLGMIPSFLELFDPDFFLLAGRYTLLEQESLAAELPACVERGVGIVIGAVFNSGIGATGPVPGARYDYRPATPPELDKVARIQAVCRRHGVPLAAAALQFPLAHPAVASVIPGPITPEQVQLNLAGVRHPIPPDLWRELKAERLLREDAPTP
ncbi:MAG: L-fuco-beta-pyranose dehydrogenase [uncultured Thermomicrobiales bacterium]|uniref:L-fuco-beta-pyranose dehydrogenase n=1 Tax=uncultured Thermomicrobiales bacterium TaxID=1645740 RepID=A0A6J4VKC1_9BACT|nr:MAG: L-fuco-beta-pyranose dehydrogenase [uncultured Thermomicrobiales bacterium]